MHSPASPPENPVLVGRRRRETLASAAAAAGVPLPDEPDFRSALERAVIGSDFIHQSFLRHPALLADLLADGDLGRAYSPGTYREKLRDALAEVADENALGSALRRLRLREMIRIAWRDLNGRASLEETMADLTGMAEAILDAACRSLYGWQAAEDGTPRGKDGAPQQLVVIGMGKLGGGELNFSSDIDLIFAFPEEGTTDGGPRAVTHLEFFSRLCRRLLAAIGASTPEGRVFRVDTRLRPYGDSGPLAMDFDALEAYYQWQGREWERYALIKARPVAGDLAAGARLMKRLKPFIYRRYLDFGTFDSLREMKQKIVLETRRKGARHNIKLGPGGIREIEFFGQVFQLIRGGLEPALQERRILKVLDILSGEGWVPVPVTRELQAAYRFLRQTEHRLQEVADQQTHTLPADPAGRARLAFSLGFASWEALAAELEGHLARVHHHFENLLAAPENQAPRPADQERRRLVLAELGSVWQRPAAAPQNLDILAGAGFHQPGGVIRILEGLEQDPHTRALTASGRDRLDKLIPRILYRAGQKDPSAVSLARIIDLIKTVERRTCYISLLLENPAALDHLITLATASPWIVSFLARHPAILGELLDSQTLFVPPTREELRADLDQRLSQVPDPDMEYQMEALRVFKQVHTLRVAAAEVNGALPLMKVSDRLTDIAETVVERVMELAYAHLAAKYGRPACRIDGRPCGFGFGVIAYGKLGGLELGYSSDLDLLFLHAGTDDKTGADDRAIDSAQFFIRLGQRIIHFLTLHTPAGTLYEADMRLRPQGSAGLLVVSADAFREYQLRQAWTWEHQALIRARPICGDPMLLEHFQRVRREALALPREPDRLRDDVNQMRRRLRQENASRQSGHFDLKQGTGGIVDIEFLVQYLVLRHAAAHPGLLEWTDNVRLLDTLAVTGVLDAATAALLKDAYLAYRAEVHRLSLEERPAVVPDHQFEALSGNIRRTWQRLLEG